MENIRTYGLLSALFLIVQILPAQAAGLNNSIYVPVEPCRVGNSLPAKVTAGNSVEWLAYGPDLSTQGGAGAPGCLQPKTDMKPIGVALNITVVGNQATGNGNVVAYPADGSVPASSLVNYKPGTNIANSTIVGLCQDGVCDGRFKLQSNNSDVPVIADVQGYFYPAPGNVANVAITGGDYTSPVDAMADVANWCGVPSATNQCLLKIAPGAYTVTETVVMQQWVSIQGSGQSATKIIGAVSTANPDATSSIFRGVNNADLTDLSIENTGVNGFSMALFNSAASPRIERVTASASSGATTTNYGVFNDSISSPTMTNVTASASGGSSNLGVFNRNSSPTMTNVTATVSGGLFNYAVFNANSSSPTMINVTATSSGGTSYGTWSVSSAPFIQDSILEGTTAGLNIDTNSAGTRVVNSKIVGGVGDIPATTNCLGNYDANLAPVTC